MLLPLYISSDEITSGIVITYKCDDIFLVNFLEKNESCIGVLGIIGYLPFYFHGYRILSFLPPRIWDTVFNIFVTFRDIEYLGKLIRGIFANL